MTRFIARAALLATTGFLTPVASTAPRSPSKAVHIAALTNDAFGSLWVDSDGEPADIEYDVRVALDGGVSPNARNSQGDTLLLQAIENNRDSVVRLLLHRGANVNLVSREDGDTPLIRASRWPRGEALPIPIIQMLLRNHANPNVRNNGGESALTLAACNGYSEVVALLLRADADFRMRNSAGLTPLQLASAPIPSGTLDPNGAHFALATNIPLSKHEGLTPEERKYWNSLPKWVRVEEQQWAQGRARSRRFLMSAGAKQ